MNITFKYFIPFMLSDSIYKIVHSLTAFHSNGISHNICILLHFNLMYKKFRLILTITNINLFFLSN